MKIIDESNAAKEKVYQFLPAKSLVANADASKGELIEKVKLADRALTATGAELKPIARQTKINAESAKSFGQRITEIT